MLYSAAMEAPTGRRAVEIGPAGGYGGAAPWWWGEPFGYGPQGLALDGHALAELARGHGTPLYVYSRAAVRAQLASLRRALDAIDAPTRVYYALKANRCPAVLEVLRAEGDAGIDASSPREVDLARAAGFEPREISVTTSMPSDRDLDAFAAERVHVNLDSFSALRRYGARVPRGTPVGLRLDCPVEVGYGSDPKLVYANSKFGILHDAFDDAVRSAEATGLVVTTLHVHCGWGLRRADAAEVEWLFVRMAELARRVPTVEVVNVGGGLGARRRADDRPLALAAWADALRRSLVPSGCTIACEPGTLLVDRAGVLLVEANTVERRAGTTWIGVDAGHNVNVYMAHYGVPVEVVHVRRPLDAPEVLYAVAGNINESNDVFARATSLPEVVEGDLLALMPAGAYGASMASDHCLRGFAPEVTV